MTYKTISVNAIIAKIYRDFKPSNSGWITDAVEWVGEAVEIMRCWQGYNEINVELEVIDHRAKLPCDLSMLLGIEYNNTRLQRSGGINNKRPCSCLDNLVCNYDESYTLNPNYIHTTFKTGCITVYYLGIEVDCDGLPYIVDDPLYTNAITWYIMMKMCLRGFKHQTVDFRLCEQEWLIAYPRAQNRAKMPDIDGYEVFKKSWLGLARSTNLTNQFFNTIAGNTVGANGTVPPGTLVQSFPALGDNLNNI